MRLLTASVLLVFALTLPAFGAQAQSDVKRPGQVKPGEAKAEPPEPTEIRSMKATAGEDSAEIVWQANEGKGIAGWAVQWSSFSGIAGRPGSSRRLLDAETREYTIKALRPGRLYLVYVFPYYKQGSRVVRAPISGLARGLEVRVGKPGIEGPPAAPGGVRAVADGSRVRLTWDPSKEQNVAGYEIFRKAPGQKQATPYMKLFINALIPTLVRADGGRVPAVGHAEILDVDLQKGKEYKYAVRAVTSGPAPAFSEFSRPVTIKTEPYVFRPSDLLLVVNTSAKNAQKIAVAYSRARGIRSPQVVNVKLPVRAAISRGTYNELLLAPVQAYLRTHPRTTIVLLVRGVPWQIRPGRHSRRGHATEAAAVDSELALARIDGYALEGRVPNPLYDKAATLTPVNGILGVCRLDGPDDDVANDLVRRAIVAEKRGIDGIAFFDARGLKRGNYASGDEMIRRAADIMKKDGRLTVKLDDQMKVIDLSSMRGKIGFYYGWYAGTFRPKNKDFRFGRGAVAAHLHSSSAVLIAPNKCWVGPLLLHGATAALGTASEPYLDGFPTADGLVNALLKGRNFAEAALSANRYLSWMSVHIGDPLYRPFKPKEPVEK